MRDQLRRVPVARLAGEALDAAIREQRHAALVTATVSGLRQTIDRNRAPLRRRLGAQAPAWVPDAVNDLVFDRAEAVIHAFLQQLAADPDHELRRALDEQLLDLTARLRTDPDVGEQVGAAVDGGAQRRPPARLDPPLARRGPRRGPRGRRPDRPPRPAAAGRPRRAGRVRRPAAGRRRAARPGAGGPRRDRPRRSPTSASARSAG
jgi:hypothetical protein